MNRPEQRVHLFDALASFENLYRAARDARRGKRFQPAVARFHYDVARSLVELRDELVEGRYRPGPYRDRVVHHALCNVIEPLFERSFIFDSYANRVGKGTHRALDRCTEYARRFRYVLQADIRLFFPSVDHEILLGRLARRIHDPRVMELARAIVGHSNVQPPADFYFPGDNLFTPFERRKGLPIGNLTSQFWANVYLDPFDHHFRDDLGVPGYIRYVDDFLVFSDSKAALAAWLEVVRLQLDRVRLTLNERKTSIYPVSEGIPFLGFRVFPRCRRLLSKLVKRARRRLERLAKASQSGQVDMKTVSRSVAAWIAHAAHGDTRGLRRCLFGSVAFRSGGRPCGSGRFLEQQ